MKEFLDYVARSLVDNPDGVAVTVSERGDEVELTLSVDEADMGRVIGRDGRIANAIRSLLRVMGTREGVHVEDPAGAGIGVVREVFRAGEAEVYRVELTDGGELLVPAVRDVVRRIDVRGGVMVVDYASEEVR